MLRLRLRAGKCPRQICWRHTLKNMRSHQYTRNTACIYREKNKKRGKRTHRSEEERTGRPREELNRFLQPSSPACRFLHSSLAHSLSSLLSPRENRQIKCQQGRADTEAMQGRRADYANKQMQTSKRLTRSFCMLDGCYTVGNGVGTFLLWATTLSSTVQDEGLCLNPFTLRWKEGGEHENMLLQFSLV